MRLHESSRLPERDSQSMFSTKEKKRNKKIKSKSKSQNIGEDQVQWEIKE